MSLEEKVTEFTKRREGEGFVEKDLSEKRKIFTRCSLLPDEFDAVPVPLSDEQKKLVAEAVGMITNWRQVKLSFKESEAVFEPYYREVRTTFVGEDGLQFVEYEWKRGDVRCTRLAPAAMITEGRWRPGMMKRAQKALPQFVQETNEKRREVHRMMDRDDGWEVRPQKYVILEYRYGKQTLGKTKDIFILFDDVTLFPGPRCHDFIFEGRSVFNKYQGWFEHGRDLEDWLAENVIRINAAK